MNSLVPAVFGIQSTAGAVPVRNDKGEVSMQKVKVHRYVSGKRPDYAPVSSSEEDSDNEGFIDHQQRSQKQARLSPPKLETLDVVIDEKADDPRLRRLGRTRTRYGSDESDVEDRMERHREQEKQNFGDNIKCVKMLTNNLGIMPLKNMRRWSESEKKEVYVDRPFITSQFNKFMGGIDKLDWNVQKYRIRFRGKKWHIHEPEVIEEGESVKEMREGDESSDEGDLSDEEIERRRQLLRQKLLSRRDEEEMEVLEKEEENKSPASSEEESSEFEEYSDSEEESGPRLKPVFVRKKDRITVIEKEKEMQKMKQIELESKKSAEERRRQTLKMIEDDIRKEATTKPGEEPSIQDVNTDDENDEVEYEAWKLRELKRIKRDREEREAMEKERLELERIRNMTEEERRIELRNNPKIITNKSTKGKYKFLQKYYHRGVFYLDQDDEVFKRDFSSATLEDHFDKTILPKVMQVKNFGRSGRTKYTHLVDQDTTQLDSPWASDTAQNLKFYNNQAAGMRQQFDKPTKIMKKRSMK